MLVMAHATDGGVATPDSHRFARERQQTSQASRGHEIDAPAGNNPCSAARGIDTERIWRDHVTSSQSRA